MRFTLAILLTLASSLGYAQNWKIGSYLEVSPADDVAATFQIFEDYDPQEKIVVGWQGQEIGYLMLTDAQPGGEASERHWEGLLKEIQAGASNNKLHIIEQGEFLTTSKLQVTYKTLQWNSNGETNVQMYSLINGSVDAYWVIAIPYNATAIDTTNGVMDILKTAKLLR